MTWGRTARPPSSSLLVFDRSGDERGGRGTLFGGRKKDCPETRFFVVVIKKKREKGEILKGNNCV